MRNPHRSIFPMTFQTALSLVATLDNRAFSVLKDQVRGPDSFEVGSRRCAALSAHLGVDPESVRAIVQTIGYMYEQIHGEDGGLDADGVRDVIDRDVVAEEGIDRDVLNVRLAELLESDATIEGYRRERDLKVGFLARAVGFSSVLDLRPETRNVAETARLIPLVQFRVHVAGAGDGSDSVLFQLDARALDELDWTIRDLRERLGSLRRNPHFGRAIVE